jgi:exodeoxyribonuclease VII large subunit
MKGKLDYFKNQTALLQARLKAVSPLGTLARGYAIVRHQDGRVIQKVEQASAGEVLNVLVSDGDFNVKVE